MNRKRFFVLSIVGGLAATLPRDVLAAQPAARTASGLGCRITFGDGSVSELALQPIDLVCVRHFTASYEARHSKIVRFIEVGIFEPAFRGFAFDEFSDLDALDEEVRPGESIAITYFSGALWAPPWFVADLWRASGKAKPLLSTRRASTLDATSAI